MIQAISYSAVFLIYLHSLISNNFIAVTDSQAASMASISFPCDQKHALNHSILVSTILHSLKTQPISIIHPSMFDLTLLHLSHFSANSKRWRGTQLIRPGRIYKSYWQCSTKTRFSASFASCLLLKKHEVMVFLNFS